jgi:type I restriction enzyme S subunit
LTACHPFRGSRSGVARLPKACALVHIIEEITELAIHTTINLTSRSLMHLSDICSLRSGFAFKSAEWKEEGVPGNLKYVSSTIAEDAAEFEIREGDILVSMTGYVGAVARATRAESGFLLNQRVGRVDQIVEPKILPEFLYWMLRLPSTKSQVEVFSNGSAQQNLAPSDFGKIEISVPPISEQSRIVGLAPAIGDLQVENMELARVRDELLPLLMSGRISVKEKVA